MIRLGAVFLVVGAVGGAVAAATPALLRQRDARRCEAAVAERRFPEALEVCSRAHARHPDGALAASVAVAHLLAGNRDEAWRWANLPEAAGLTRAMRVRGGVLVARREVEAAREQLNQTLGQALERDEPAEAARAAHMLAGIDWGAGRYTAAYRSILTSEREAARAGDGPALALAELAKGDVFRKLGDAQRADAAYRRALEASAPWPADHAYAQLKMGLALLQRGAPEQARGHLETALALAEPTADADLIRACRVNLAEARARSGSPELASALLDALSPEQQALWGVRVARALLAFLEADGEAAVELLARIADLPPNPDFHFEVETLRGKALAAAQRPDDAAAAWTRAIDAVERLSAAAPEHQGWVVARRREPFDHLFVLWASRGEHARAWDVVARYAQAEALQVPEEGAAQDIGERLAAAEALRENWQAVQEAPAQARLPLPAERELLVLHEAGGRLWLGVRRDGVAHFHDAGPLADYEADLHQLLGQPGDPEPAARLGEALWRAAGVREGARPLYIAATGRLRRLSFASLRHQDRHWMELRPLARVPSLSGHAGGPADAGGEPVVLGDPQGDLRHAREELRWVAARLRTHAQVGEAATREALLRARGSEVLHVAAHATVGLDGARLRLWDGEVTAHEILRQKPHARLVVLASCASSVGREAAGSDSLAAAFLRAGSGAVLATLRSVPDEASATLVQAFYEQGGRDDPVTALARAQAQVAAVLPASVWSAFIISVGPDFRAPTGR